MTLVGMTYDLRTDYIREGYSEEETAEFDQPATIDAIEETLQSLGYRTDRIGHVRALARRLVAGERWDLVFNIAEGLKGFGREAQVPCLLDAYGVPYVFSDPLVLSLTSPAGRPIQTTRDLPGFWRGSWADVAKDMRGRYPRHNWPDDPTQAVASLNRLIVLDQILTDANTDLLVDRLRLRPSFLPVRA